MTTRLIAISFVIFIATIILIIFNPFKKEKSAGVQVSTAGQPSAVFLNGQYLNKTPLIEKNIKAGKYTVKIQPDDTSLAPYETIVELQPGSLSVITWKAGKTPETSGGVLYELHPIQDNQNSEVSFSSIPDTAIVELAGERKEFTPFIFTNVIPGNTEFEVTLPSYQPQRHTINVLGGHRMVVKVKLAKVDSASENLQVESLLDTTNVASNSAAATLATSPLTTNEESLVASESGSKKTVRITATNYFVDGKEVVRVRATPSSEGLPIGYADVGTKYEHTGKVEKEWYEIIIDNQKGWVSGEYIAQ